MCQSYKTIILEERKLDSERTIEFPDSIGVFHRKIGYKMKEKIFAIIEDILKVPAGTITEDMRISDIEQWDSLAHVMIIGAIEEELNVDIPLDKTADIVSVKQLLESLEIK